MPAERTPMRQVREVLRLKTAGVSGNEIARRLGVAPSTVRLTLQRLAAAGLSWPLPAETTDRALMMLREYVRLRMRKGGECGSSHRPMGRFGPG
jgi:IS30 family transposase